MLLHDLFGVFRLHMPVPDGLWINDYRGPMLALIQAERFVDADARRKIGGLGMLLELHEECAGSIGSAGWARSVGGAYVMTDEDVVFKRRQRKSSCFESKAKDPEARSCKNGPGQTDLERASRTSTK